MPEKNTLPPLPEPTLEANGDVFGHENVDGFTADQIAARDRQIVELCAAICDGLVMALDNGGKEYRREATASQCAAAIRSLVKGGE